MAVFLLGGDTIRHPYIPFNLESSTPLTFILGSKHLRAFWCATNLTIHFTNTYS